MITEFGRKAYYFVLLAFFLIIAGCGSAGNDPAVGACAAGCASSGSSSSSGNQAPGGICVAGAKGVTSATLSWSQPTANLDGSTLTDLTGYRIHYGTAPGNYTASVTVNGASATSYTISNLAIGHEYFFAVSALDASGDESAYSNELCKSIN